MINNEFGDSKNNENEDNKSKNQKYIVNNGIGDYTKEKYENPEEFTIEDFEKYMAENR